MTRRLEAELKRSVLPAVSAAHRTLSQMSLDELTGLAEEALASGSLTLVEELVKFSPYAVVYALAKSPSRVLSLVQSSSFDQLVFIYRRLRHYLSEDLKAAFRVLVSRRLIRVGLALSREASSGGKLKRVQYSEACIDFDLEQSIEKILENPLKATKYESYVGVTRMLKSRPVVAVLDISGSMFGKKIVLASIATAVLACSIAPKDYALIAFSTKPHVVKRMGELVQPTQVVEAILDLSPGGYTNIKGALEAAEVELKKASSPDRLTLLLTDGQYNVGGDPRGVAPRLTPLHLLHIKTKSQRADWGAKVSLELAKAGSGAYQEVTSIYDLSRALYNLMSM
ncbi:MAG: hypothetical protein DRN99_02145 [Thermoproteota archaeon]|nr:MAG: hypothetical protein DRN99_02145 [Candidatus Korarchaeota archaeon]